jgi:predicted HAD superfamily Cof-like phosphohydrolase
MQHIITDVFDEIQESNMSKLGEDGKPILREDGKILKGPGYFRPDISKFIKVD